MKGLMQDWPLVVPKVLDHAARWHGEREMVTRNRRGPDPADHVRRVARTLAKARAGPAASRGEQGRRRGDARLEHESSF